MFTNCIVCCKHEMFIISTSLSAPIIVNN